MKHFLVTRGGFSPLIKIVLWVFLSFLVVRALSRSPQVFVNTTIECITSPSSQTQTNVSDVEPQDRRRLGVLALAFAPNNKSIASANYSAEGGITLMNVSSQKGERLLKGQSTAVAFSPDNKWILHSTSSTLGLIEAKTGKNHNISKEHQPIATVLSVAFAPNNKWFATGDANGYVLLYNAANEKFRLLGRSKTGDTDIVVFSPDSKLVASGGDDRVVHLWNIETGEDKKLGVHPGDEIFGIAFSPDGKSLVSIGSNDPTSPCLRSLSTGESKCLTNDRNFGDPYSVAFAPDGESFVVGWSKGVAISYEVKSGQAKTLISQQSAIYSVAFSANGKLLATSGADQKIHLWEAKSGKAISFEDEVTEVSSEFVPGLLDGSVW